MVCWVTRGVVFMSHKIMAAAEIHLFYQGIAPREPTGDQRNGVGLYREGPANIAVNG